MAMTSMEADKIISEAAGWFRARVAQHYVTLSDEDMDTIGNELSRVLSKYTSDANIQNRQYNPATDQVEEI